MVSIKALLQFTVCHTGRGSHIHHIICQGRVAPLLTTVSSPHGPRLSYLVRSLSTDIRCRTLEEVADYMKCDRFQKIVVMAGAGISTPSGIPDFRTPGTGLYDNLQKYNLPYAEAIFDIEYFAHEPRPFFTWAKELYSSVIYRPNICHYFVRLLHKKDLLHRFYTQNIDGLERAAGIPEDKLMEAHGTFSTATCQKCRRSYKDSDIMDTILKDEIPICTKCKGVIKPDIVFFGEQLPKQFWEFTTDLPQADLLIVMGTSLQVYPFAGIAEAVLPDTPRLMMNQEATGSFVDNPQANDVVAKGDLVKSVEIFCELIKWKDELLQLVENSEKQYKT